MLAVVDQQRDLGVQVTPSFRRSATVDDRVRKAFGAMHVLLKAVTLSDPAVLIRCYKTYVLPHLEFASQFWQPYTSKDSQKVERVQRTFTRILYYRCFPSPTYPITLPSYTARLKALGLSALSERRVVSDLLLAYNIMHGNSFLQRASIFKFRQNRGRVTSFGIHVERTAVAARFNSFAVRVARWYGQLPAEVLRVTSANAFKNALLSDSARPLIRTFAK